MHSGKRCLQISWHWLNEWIQTNERTNERSYERRNESLRHRC